MMRRAEDDENGAAAAEGSDEEEDVPRPVVAAYDRLSEAAAALAGADEGADDESLAPAGRLEPLEIADNAEFEADNADYIIHDWEEEIRDDDDDDRGCHGALSTSVTRTVSDGLVKLRVHWHYPAALPPVI